MGVARYRGNTGALKFCGLHAGVARGGRRARLALRANRGSFDRSRRRDSKLNHHDPRLTRAVRSSIADASHELGELWHRLGRALGVHHLGHDDRHQRRDGGEGLASVGHRQLDVVVHPHPRRVVHLHHRFAFHEVQRRQARAGRRKARLRRLRVVFHAESASVCTPTASPNRCGITA